MDYLYKKSGAIFNAHSYWTKQPVDVIEKFINNNTAPNDVVLDPFCGSGMTGVACVKTNRKFILSDISPICIHIAKGYCTKYGREIKNELDAVTKEIESLYVSRCPHCGREFVADYCILEDKLESEKSLRLNAVVGHCSCGKDKIKKTPDETDMRLHSLELYKNYFYPQDPFFGNEPKRNYRRGIYKVYQLYSPRNLSALSMLLAKIKEVKDENIRQLFLFAFTAILFNCSIMSRYNPKYENTQIKMGTFYVPQYIKDNNVVLSFSRKVANILKANEIVFDGARSADGLISVADATELSSIGDGSVDYIYTDPPYSDKISYSELNLVYEAWLDTERTDTAREMIVNKFAGKSIEDYSRMFNDFLSQAKRVLKDNKKITIVFHNSSLEHWQYFQRIINTDGLKPIITEDPERLLSASKTSTQYQADNDSRCFLAFTLQKDVAYRPAALKELSKDEYDGLIKTIEAEAASKGYDKRSDRFDFIINRLLFEYNIRPDVKIL
ncbi:MAG: DNA adenine methylase [Roseburia sp.]|nr:DNA adenine methylase [Roseburia sp.]